MPWTFFKFSGRHSEEIQIKTEKTSETENYLQCEKCYTQTWKNNFELQKHKQSCPLNNITNKEEKNAEQKFVKNPKRHRRRYRTDWELTFPWLRKDEFSQDAYCTVCNLTLSPKYSSFKVHEECKKHKNNLESGSSYAKLQSSPAVAKAKFRYMKHSGPEKLIKKTPEIKYIKKNYVKLHSWQF